MNAVLSTNRKRLLLLAALLCVLAGLYAWVRGHQPAVQRIPAVTGEQRVQYITDYGWQVEPDPLEVSEITVPEQFGAVYEQYNALQKEQGFDLEPLKGEICTKYTYKVKNYPDAQEPVYVGLLVHNGLLVASEIYSAKLDGFMVGLYPCPESAATPPPVYSAPTVPEDAPVFAYTEPEDAGAYPTD